MVSKRPGKGPSGLFSPWGPQASLSLWPYPSSVCLCLHMDSPLLCVFSSSVMKWTLIFGLKVHPKSQMTSSRDPYLGSVCRDPLCKEISSQSQVLGFRSGPIFLGATTLPT